MNCREPDFRLRIEVASVDSAEVTAYFVKGIDDDESYEIDRKTFRDLMQLKIAGELRGLRELFDAALSTHDAPESLVTILQRIADR